MQMLNENVKRVYMLAINGIRNYVSAFVQMHRYIDAASFIKITKS